MFLRLLWVALHATSSLFGSASTPVIHVPPQSCIPPAPASASLASLSHAQQAAAAESAEQAAVVELLPAIVAACGAQSVDELIASNRSQLLHLCRPSEVANVELEAGVLGQLLLTDAQLAPLLLWHGYTPGMSLADTSSARGLDSIKHAGAQSTCPFKYGSLTASTDRPSPDEACIQATAASSGGADTHPANALHDGKVAVEGTGECQLWDHTSQSAAVCALHSQLALMANSTRVAVCVLACLSNTLPTWSKLNAGVLGENIVCTSSPGSCKEAEPGADKANPTKAISGTAGELVLRWLAQAVATFPTGHPKTLALHCIQIAASNAMLSSFTPTAQFEPVVVAVASQGLSSTAALTRLQACDTAAALLKTLQSRMDEGIGSLMQGLGAGLVAKVEDRSSAVQTTACEVLASSFLPAAKVFDAHNLCMTACDAQPAIGMVGFIRDRLGKACEAAGEECPQCYLALQQSLVEAMRIVKAE